MATLRPPYVCLSCRLHAKRILTPLPLRHAFSTSSSRLSSSTSTTTPRPPTAPKQFPDTKHIRENAALYSQNCLDRNYPDLAQYPYEIQRLSAESRQLQDALKEPTRKVKEIQSAVSQLAISSPKTRTSLTPEQTAEQESQLSSLRAAALHLKTESATLTTTRANHIKEIDRLALALPNLTSPDTPAGSQPRLLRYINYDPTTNLPSHTTSHVTIGTSLSLLDFSSAATTSGWGWYYLTNEAALLEQALIQYALSVALRRGWQAVSPPSLVYTHIAHACGFQPRDAHNEQQIYQIEQSERDVERGRPGRCLTGTAEIPMAAMWAAREMEVQQFPVKYVGVSRCYRAEAGSRGVDTKGLYRVHEFSKVELFGWGLADGDGDGSTAAASTLFEDILALQSEILASLNLPCRVLEMPAHDLGASAARKIDIEVLFPSRMPSNHSPVTSATTSEKDLEEAWGEVTSASICTDYQTRRLGTRIKGAGAGAGKFPHTVNGTAMAVPRIVAALLEHGWDEKRGVVVLPEVLKGWMGGRGVIGAEKE
ncbi:serine-tRNA ligase [Helicocarpus griseus UAMH5409]|uniref:serine--tRNA ligase n=1 Tax=Helicocarpus griseus UAMH5409 TaxID=1447875 RepID=A0A2B7WI14_9EURO|nr:serine-tRNA ligase [Helicocarpus griseus UAMH5409]